MKEAIWKFAAHFIANRTWLVNWIIRSAAKRPYFHLDGYMNRWWLTPSWLLTKDEDGNSVPYEWLPIIFKCRVHYILRADHDRHLHDHPADNRSIVLRGYYDEQDIFGRSNIRTIGDTVLRRAECFHKIAYVSSRGVWTLWFLGQSKNQWGFLVEGRKIRWKSYLGRKEVFMKERPILFKGEMVRAILEGRKTQTRRVVKPSGKHWKYDEPEYTDGHMTFSGEEYIDESFCPYGQPGDRLFVREAFRLCAEADETKPSDTDEAYRVWYEADAPHQPGFGKLRPSMFMPRWASRIMLEITGVRVQRLQDISEADARQEGIYSDRVIVSTNCHSGHHTEVHDDRYFFGNEPHEGFECAIEAFAELWESIKGHGSWDANPWVWVVEFKRVQS